MHLKTIVGAAIILGGGLAASAATADPGKDESGKGRERGYYKYDGRDYGRDDGGYRQRARVPRGHLPPPGECKVWYDDLPPGHQPPPTSCRRAERKAARTGGEVITSRGRVRSATYAGYYSGDAYYRDRSACYAYDRYGNCIR